VEEQREGYLRQVGVCMDVLFVVMPFADISRPAISVSLLQAETVACGFTSRIEYFNIELAELIGRDVYEQLANGCPSESLVGEWFFADTVFREGLPEEADYISKIFRAYTSDAALTEKIQTARRHRYEFIEQCAARIRQFQPHVVGFTTTFHQTCACLSVARKLKDLPNPPVIILGGANCEGEMGLQIVQSFPWIDYACTGEGERAFPELLHHLLRDGQAQPVQGIAKRGDTSATSAEPVKDLDTLPVPEYTDYFERLRSSFLRKEMKVDLVIETSRGCWWGAKQHCTFCGLNGDAMAFRSKSPERVFSELATLTRIYGLKSVECVDNILDMKYVPALFRRLEESGMELELFYEVKSNLRYDQLAALRAGGVCAIQPGIESFSNQVLRLMRKGCTSLQNIQLLRWCEELGVKAGWNLLAGFPGESPSEYDRMAELIPLLTHLQPPAGCSPVRLDRFSPFFTRAEQLGLSRVRPAPAYYYVFPLGRKELARLAYFFDFDYADDRRPLEYIAGLSREVQRWLAAKANGESQSPRLDAVFADGEIVVTDTRSSATAASHHLSGAAAKIYMQCDSAQSLAGLRKRFSGQADDVIGETLPDLLDAKLMIRDEDHYLSLAVFRNRPRQARIEHGHIHTPTQETADSHSLFHLG
jgi:ribosomal peptide maturation radical SAM protein 1